MLTFKESNSHFTSCFSFKFFKTCYLCDKNIYYNQFTLSCSHFFHKQCIKSWIMSYQFCPICKKRSTLNNTNVKQSFKPYMSFR